MDLYKENMISDGVVDLVHRQLKGEVDDTLRPHAELMKDIGIRMAPRVMDIIEAFAIRKYKIAASNDYARTLKTVSSMVRGAVVLTGNELCFSGSKLDGAIFHGNGTVIFKKCIVKGVDISEFSGTMIFEDCTVIKFCIHKKCTVMATRTDGYRITTEGPANPFSYDPEIYALSNYMVLAQTGSDTVSDNSVYGKVITLNDKLETQSIHHNIISNSEIYIPKKVSKVTITGSILDNVTLVYHAGTVIEFMRTYAVGDISVSYIGELRISGTENISILNTKDMFIKKDTA